MYKHTYFYKPNGAERNQEIYNWMLLNCSDLFDSIIIDEERTKITCSFNSNEIFALSSNENNYLTQIYYTTYAQFDEHDTSSYNIAYIEGMYRLTNGILIDLNPTTDFCSDNRVKKIPTVALIKNGDEYIIILLSRNNILKKGYLNYPIYKDFTLYYRIESNINGYGSLISKTFGGYYSTSNSVILTPMYCTNANESPVEKTYWLNKSRNRDIGLMTIGGHEYFSNGVFCIRND